MAHKRRLTLERAKNEPPSSEQDHNAALQEMGWKEWFTTVYARYWYVIICIAVSLLGMLWVRWTLMMDWDVALLFLILVTPLEAYGYYFFWVKRRRRKNH